MHPDSFDYHRPASLSEAVAALGSLGDGAKLLAGGHSLLPIMKLRLASPEHLIDIGRVPELQGIRRHGDAVSIGALTTHHQVASDAAVGAVAPLLAETAARVGDPQVRNRGTIGGALAHADAAADYPAAILALDATIVAQGPDGQREIAAQDFFRDFLTTALEPTEILTEVRIASPGGDHGWSYQKLANQASGYAIVGVAAIVTRDERDVCRDARIGVTGAAAVAWRAEEAESQLRGAILDAGTIASATAAIGEGVDMLDDLHGSAAYRLRVTRGLAARAIMAAAQRASASNSG